MFVHEQRAVIAYVVLWYTGVAHSGVTGGAWGVTSVDLHHFLVGGRADVVGIVFQIGVGQLGFVSEMHPAHPLRIFDYDAAFCEAEAEAGEHRSDGVEPFTRFFGPFSGFLHEQVSEVVDYGEFFVDLFINLVLAFLVDEVISDVVLFDNVFQITYGASFELTVFPCEFEDISAKFSVNNATISL